MLRYTTDGASPDLVAFYDIRPGNGAVYSCNPGTRTGPISSTHRSLWPSVSYRYAGALTVISETNTGAAGCRNVDTHKASYDLKRTRSKETLYM